MSWSLVSLTLVLALASASVGASSPAATPNPNPEAHGAESHGHGSSSSDLTERTARTSSRDVHVPRALVAKVEKEYDSFLQKLGVINRSPVKRGLLNIRVDLVQKRGGGLFENARVITPLGGGVVDLSELVTPVRGAFFAKIETQYEDGKTPEDLRVFYVSRAVKRTLAGDTFGAGCNTWMELTSYFKKTMAAEGIHLYTADQRYLSVLAGTFVAVSFAKEALSVASLTFTDSRYPQVMCE